MKKKLEIGVVGLGRIGWRFHCKAIAQSRDFELAAVTDAQAERCREAETTYHCRVFTDYARMLKETALDAVTIAAPTHLHFPMASVALRRGLHVMMEKPLAPDLRTAEGIVRLAKRHKRALTVYQPRRLMAEFQQLKRLIARGRIGSLYSCRIVLHGFSRRNDWQSMRKFGGGMLNNFGAHCIDQALQLIGYDIKRVFCRLGRVASVGDADDVVNIMLETRKGLLGEIDINQAYPVQDYCVEALGTQGTIACRFGELRAHWFRKSDLAGRRLDVRLAGAGRAYPDAGVRFREKTVAVDPKYAVDVYADFARAIRCGKPPFVLPEQTLAVMRIIDLCRRNSRKIVETPICKTP